MRNRLLIGLLFFSLFGWGQVPDTNTFTLDTVVKVVNPATNDLSACFSAAVKANFDPLYDSIGYAPVNSLLRFRNYQASEAPCDTCYGLLYNWYAVNTGKLAPTGWHVPTDAEWTTLSTYLGGEEVAGGKMKTTGTCNWIAPNEGATNESGFSGLPGGSRYYQDGTFFNIGLYSFWWSSTEYSTNFAWFRRLTYDLTTVYRNFLYKRFGYSVRCLRDTYEGWENDVPVVDYDGNEYDVVEIGTQLWLVQNLKTTHYNDGETIPNVEDGTAWAALTTGALCAYDNDWDTYACVTRPVVLKHGYLYNWYAVTDARNIAASGWHVPTDTEWTTLTDYLINNGYGYDGSGDDIAKSMAATTGWDISTNVGVPGNDPASNNSSGFSALPGGSRVGGGNFGYIGGNGYWWSSTEGSTSNAWGRNLLYYDTTVNLYYGYKDYGYSVRCLRDSTTLSHGQSGTYTGNDGKVYRTICIGTQEWLADNLAETKYRNGDTIPTVTDNTTWAGLTTGAKCAYNNDESNVME